MTSVPPEGWVLKGDLKFAEHDTSDFDRKLTALAERLGVAPHTPDGSFRFIFARSDGVGYDVFDLVNAVLDKLDKAG